MTTTPPVHEALSSPQETVDKIRCPGTSTAGGKDLILAMTSAIKEANGKDQVGHDIQGAVRGWVAQAMKSHTARKGCRWVPGAEDLIMELPSFQQLCEDIERFEICQASGVDLGA
jgi:hypothetical protein